MTKGALAMLEATDEFRQADDGVLFSPVSAKNPFRRRRMAAVIDMMRPIIAARGTCRVLDLGGTPEYWLLHRELWTGLPVEFTLLNTYRPTLGASGFSFVPGDARDLGGMDDGSFDLIHSNSVIEHVGAWADMKAMAGEVRRVGRAYFVQTPYVGFPIEPHFRLPFFHWLPAPVQMSIVMARRNGYMEKAGSIDAAMGHVESARLLGARQMRTLFPDAELVFERVLGFRKSMMAMRPWTSGEGR